MVYVCVMIGVVLLSILVSPQSTDYLTYDLN